MIIHQHYVDNSLRNFNYVLACPTTKEAVAIDPLDHQAVTEIIQTSGYQLVGIINTHDHHDHVGGNQPLIDALGLSDQIAVYAHHRASHIPAFTHGLQEGDEVSFGQCTLQVLDTPGHTHAHVCLLGFSALKSSTQDQSVQSMALFSGDTLFNAGAGNCRSGDVDSLYESFAEKLHTLDDDTVLYPGHDYLENNCRFTLDREPDNQAAQSLLEDLAENHSPHSPYRTTIGEERKINAFFRLTSDSIRQKLIAENLLSPDDLQANQADRKVFTALRAKRDKW